MNPPLRLLAVLALQFHFSIGAAQAAPTIRVVETFPARPSVTLARDQHFYLHLTYETDRPIRIWITPYYQGKPVAAGSSPSGRYAGKGNALAWFFFMEPGTRADEVRIRAGDGGTGTTLTVASYRVEIAGGSQPAPAAGSPWAQKEPAWLTYLQEQDKQRREADFAATEAESGPGSYALAIVLLLGGAGLSLAGLAVPVWAMRRWRGGWRIAAALPCALLGLVILNIVAGVTIDPTSHNLWPFEVLIAGLTALGLIAALAVMRRLVSAGR